MIDAEFAGAAIREAIAEERKAAHDWLARLDEIEESINGASPPSAGPKPKRKRTTKEAQAKERAERLSEYLIERGERISGPEARDALGFTASEFSRAADRLEKEGRLERTGKQQYSRYEARTPSPPTPEPSDNPGSGSGLILEKLGEVEFATADELADLLGVERVPRRAKILADVRQGIAIPGVRAYREGKVRVG